MPELPQKRLATLIIVLAFLTQVFAQGGATGAILGTVVDPSGAVLANAEIKILNQETGAVARSMKTDATGSFNATLLPVGTYTVTVNSPGFREGKVPAVVGGGLGTQVLRAR